MWVWWRCRWAWDESESYELNEDKWSWASSSQMRLKSPRLRKSSTGTSHHLQINKLVHKINPNLVTDLTKPYRHSIMSVSWNVILSEIRIGLSCDVPENNRRLVTPTEDRYHAEMVHSEMINSKVAIARLWQRYLLSSGLFAHASHLLLYHNRNWDSFRDFYCLKYRFFVKFGVFFGILFMHRVRNLDFCLNDPA